MLLRLGLEERERLALLHIGQRGAVSSSLARVLDRLGVDLEEAGELHDLTAGAQLDPPRLDVDVVWSNTAGTIWHATKRFQISV